MSVRKTFPFAFYQFVDFFFVLEPVDFFLEVAVFFFAVEVDDFLAVVDFFVVADFLAVEVLFFFAVVEEDFFAVVAFLVEVFFVVVAFFVVVLFLLLVFVICSMVSRACVNKSLKLHDFTCVERNHTTTITPRRNFNKRFHWATVSLPILFVPFFDDFDDFLPFDERAARSASRC